jgi:hypothetical protein
MRMYDTPRTDRAAALRWLRTALWLQQGGETLSKPTHFENREGAY